MNIFTSHDFNLTDQMIIRYQNHKKDMGSNLKQCQMCGKDLSNSAIEMGSLICLGSNDCHFEFFKEIMTHEFNRLGLNKSFQHRFKPIMKLVTFTGTEFENKFENFEKSISQGDIVTCMRESDGYIPEFIVVEHVDDDGFRQEYLALRNMKTNEIISFLDINGKCTSVRKALPTEIKKYNVWIA